MVEAGSGRIAWFELKLGLRLGAKAAPALELELCPRLKVKLELRMWPSLTLSFCLVRGKRPGLALGAGSWTGAGPQTRTGAGDVARAQPGFREGIGAGI